MRKELIVGALVLAAPTIVLAQTMTTHPAHNNSHGMSNTSNMSNSMGMNSMDSSNSMGSSNAMSGNSMDDSTANSVDGESPN